MLLITFHFFPFSTSDLAYSWDLISWEIRLEVNNILGHWCFPRPLIHPINTLFSNRCFSPRTKGSTFCYTATPCSHREVAYKASAWHHPVFLRARKGLLSVVQLHPVCTGKKLITPPEELYVFDELFTSWLERNNWNKLNQPAIKWVIAGAHVWG